MPSTDREQLTREAVTTILNANAALRTVCGRSVGLCIERNAFSLNTPLPIAVVDMESVDMGTGPITCLIDGVANGTTAGKLAREVCEAAAAALTYTAFDAQGLPIVPQAEIRESVAPDDPLHFGVQRDGDPTLHQARATVPLLYCE